MGLDHEPGKDAAILHCTYGMNLEKVPPFCSAHVAYHSDKWPRVLGASHTCPGVSWRCFVESCPGPFIGVYMWASLAKMGSTMVQRQLSGALPGVHSSVHHQTTYLCCLAGYVLTRAVCNPTTTPAATVELKESVMGCHTAMAPFSSAVACEHMAKTRCLQVGAFPDRQRFDHAGNYSGAGTAHAGWCGTGEPQSATTLASARHASLAGTFGLHKLLLLL
eukprot:363464-Chlamydomonas_euryale.AAC.1